MSQESGVKGMNSQLSALQLKSTAVCEELEAAAQKSKQLLKEIAESYEKLLGKYTALKDTSAANALSSSHTEEPDAIRGYVLVLVDAHSSKFDNALLCNGEDGGANAATALKSAISDHIKQGQTENAACNIIARVYANFEVLASDIATTEDTKRNCVEAVQRFARGFSSTYSFFDFVDVASKSKCMENILDLLLWHLADPQCKHIFIGECISSASALLEDTKSHERVTFIEGQIIDLAPQDMGFRSVALPPFVGHKWGNNEARDTSAQVELDAGSSRAPQKIIVEGPQGYFENNRYIAGTPQKEDVSSLTASKSSGRSNSTYASSIMTTRLDFIPINSTGHRLDKPLRLPTSAEQTALKNRDKKKKLCSTFHLVNYCPSKSCPYDHTPISALACYALQYN